MSINKGGIFKGLISSKNLNHLNDLEGSKKVKDIWLHERMIKFKQDRVYFFKGKLTLIVLKEEYDNLLVMHRGKKSSICLVSE